MQSYVVYFEISWTFIRPARSVGQSASRPVGQSASRPVPAASRPVIQLVSRPVGQSVSQSVSPQSIQMSSSFVGTGWTMVFKVVAGTSVSTNIQEFWSLYSSLNLQDTSLLNVGSSVKKSYKSRYVKRWTSVKPYKVGKHGDN